jgi:DNA polymerase III delta prime subunit
MSDSEEEAGYGWFQGEDEPEAMWHDDAAAGVDTCSNAMLLTGPPGCGKTAVVYAVAQVRSSERWATAAPPLGSCSSRGACA